MLFFLLKKSNCFVSFEKSWLLIKFDHELGSEVNKNSQF